MLNNFRPLTKIDLVLLGTTAASARSIKKNYTVRPKGEPVDNYLTEHCEKEGPISGDAVIALRTYGEQFIDHIIHASAKDPKALTLKNQAAVIKGLLGTDKGEDLIHLVEIQTYALIADQLMLSPEYVQNQTLESLVQSAGQPGPGASPKSVTLARSR